MSKQDGMVFGLAGLVTWTATAAFYLAFGGRLLEAAFWFYVLNALLVSVAVIFVFRALLRLRRTPHGRRQWHALAFCLPGVVVGCLTLASFRVLCPAAPPESLGRYGAFLVFVYAVMIASTLDPPKARKDVRETA